MKKNIAGSLILLIAGLLFLPFRMVFAQGEAGIVDANNQFAFELYSRYQSKTGNIFFSPFSIFTALAMTYEGARGQTAEEIRSVFHFPKSDSERRDSFLAINNRINSGHEQFSISTANALWAQEKYPFLEEYFKVIHDYYGGEVRNLDFIKDKEASRKTINSWVEEKTNYKIKNLITSLDTVDRLLITNAVYFKGKWLAQFEKSDTERLDFKISLKDTVKVEMMKMFDKSLYYAETEQLQVLELPYEGKELSMLIILPKDISLETVEASLNSREVADLINMLAKENVDVYLPKFKLAAKYSLAGTLAQMGMPTAFKDADFSGMTGKRDLCISEVIHQAFADVNEEGTEAAAATAVKMYFQSVDIAETKPKIFKADHPFIFLIHENETGNILFLGRVSDPTQ